MIPATSPHLTPFLSDELPRALLVPGGPIPEQAPPVPSSWSATWAICVRPIVRPTKRQLCVDRFVVDEIARIGGDCD